MDEQEDQVQEESQDEETSKEQSKETKEEAKDEPNELIKGLQKGYTQTRQDLSRFKEEITSEISGVKESLEQIASALNSKSGAEEGDAEYITPAKLKTILSEERNAQTKAQEKSSKEANAYIEKAISDLEDDGIISSEKEKGEFTQFAIKIGEPNLYKAAVKWQKEKGNEKLKETAKKVAHKQEGSSVANSKKSGGQEQGGVNYLDTKKDWSEITGGEDIVI